MDHPVSLQVAMPESQRNRLTVAFRPILAIPHVLMIGGPAFGILGAGYRVGVLGAVAMLAALFDWCAIIVTGRPVERLHGLKLFYLHWRSRALVYMGLLRDEYPPLGDADYPARLVLPEMPTTRDRVAVAFRPILLIPQLIVTAVLLLAWLVVVIIAWFEIVITGRLSAGLWRFDRDVVRYVLRVETYALLVHDHYPPFVLADAAEREAPLPAAT